MRVLFLCPKTDPFMHLANQLKFYTIFSRRIQMQRANVAFKPNWRFCVLLFSGGTNGIVDYTTEKLEY